MGLWQNHCEGSRPSCSTRTAVAKGPLDYYYHYYMNISKALRYSTHCQGISQFHLHTLRFIRKQNEPYLPLPSQPQPVLIYRPRRDGRLSRPWCEVAPAEIQTCELPIANPAALYHWLPVRQRVTFKLATLVHKCLNGQTSTTRLTSVVRLATVAPE